MRDEATFATDMFEAIKADTEVFVEDFVREVKGLIGQFGVHEARTDAEKIVAFEALSQGLLPWQKQVVDEKTGQAMPPAMVGMFWALSLPNLRGVKGLLDSGAEIYREYLAAKKRQMEGM